MFRLWLFAPYYNIFAFVGKAFSHYAVSGGNCKSKAVILVQSVNANNAICNISKGVTYMEKATKLI